MQQAGNDVTNGGPDLSFNVWNSTLQAIGASSGNLLDDASLYLEQATSLVTLMLSSIEDVERPEENAQLIINPGLLCSNFYTLQTLLGYAKKHVDLGHSMTVKPRA